MCAVPLAEFRYIPDSFLSREGLFLLPTDKSRWFGLSDDPQFTYLAQNVPLAEKYYPVRVENMGYLLKYKGSSAGYDFYGLAQPGPSIYPSLLNTADPSLFIKQEPLAFSAAGVCSKG